MYVTNYQVEFISLLSILDMLFLYLMLKEIPSHLFSHPLYIQSRILLRMLLKYQEFLEKVKGRHF